MAALVLCIQKQLGIYSLERRLRGDLIEAYKMLTGKERVNKSEQTILHTCSGMDYEDTATVINEWSVLPVVKMAACFFYHVLEISYF